MSNLIRMVKACVMCYCAFYWCETSVFIEVWITSSQLLSRCGSAPELKPRQVLFNCIQNITMPRGFIIIARMLCGNHLNLLIYYLLLLVPRLLIYRKGEAKSDNYIIQGNDHYRLVFLPDDHCLYAVERKISLYRHECFTGKYITSKIHTQPHPGLEWRIFHILTSEDIDAFADIKFVS